MDAAAQAAVGSGDDVFLPTISANVMMRSATVPGARRDRWRGWRRRARRFFPAVRFTSRQLWPCRYGWPESHRKSPGNFHDLAVLRNSVGESVWTVATVATTALPYHLCSNHIDDRAALYRNAPSPISV